MVKGGRSLNPTDVYRKAERSRERRKNRRERVKVREEAVLKREDGAAYLQSQIRSLRRRQQTGDFDHAALRRLQQCEAMLARLGDKLTKKNPKQPLESDINRNQLPSQQKKTGSPESSESSDSDTSDSDDSSSSESESSSEESESADDEGLKVERKQRDNKEKRRVPKIIIEGAVAEAPDTSANDVPSYDAKSASELNPQARLAAQRVNEILAAKRRQGSDTVYENQNDSRRSQGLSHQWRGEKQPDVRTLPGVPSGSHPPSSSGLLQPPSTGLLSQEQGLYNIPPMVPPPQNSTRAHIHDGVSYGFSNSAQTLSGSSYQWPNGPGFENEQTFLPQSQILPDPPLECKHFELLQSEQQYRKAASRDTYQPTAPSQQKGSNYLMQQRYHRNAATDPLLMATQKEGLNVSKAQPVEKSNFAQRENLVQPPPPPHTPILFVPTNLRSTTRKHDPTAWKKPIAVPLSLEPSRTQEVSKKKNEPDLKEMEQAFKDFLLEVSKSSH